MRRALRLSCSNGLKTWRFTTLSMTSSLPLSRVVECVAHQLKLSSFGVLRVRVVSWGCCEIILSSIATKGMLVCVSNLLRGNDLRRQGCAMHNLLARLGVGGSCELPARQRAGVYDRETQMVP